MLVCVCAALVLETVAATPASAHPLGNFTINRYSELLLGDGRLDVTYVIDMAEIPTFQEMRNIDTDGDRRASARERHAWVEVTVPKLAGHIRASVDGRPLRLAVECAVVSIRRGQANAPILRLEAHLSAPVPRSGEVAYRDVNYAGRLGWSEITARTTGRAQILEASVPAASVSDGLRSYPNGLLTSPLDVTAATVSFTANVDEPSVRRRACVAGAPTARPAANFLVSLVTWDLTPFVFALSLLLAAGAGALHALMPGHGKTITAAYLVGSGARVRHAVSAGVAVSLMHTGSVLALALASFFAFGKLAAEAVYPWLGLVSGLVALGLGAALMAVRVRARRSGERAWGTAWHVHPHHSGHDEHRGEFALAHDHHDDDGERFRHHPASRPKLMALALAGGIAPSPTAVVVLTGALATARVAYGLSLVLAFSLGLAAALTLVGLLSIRARTTVARRVGDRTVHWLPIASAAVILAVGLLVTARSAAQLL